MAAATKSRCLQSSLVVSCLTDQITVDAMPVRSTEKRNLHVALVNGSLFSVYESNGWRRRCCGLLGEATWDVVQRSDGDGAARCSGPERGRRNCLRATSLLLLPSSGVCCSRQLNRVRTGRIADDLLCQPTRKQVTTFSFFIGSIQFLPIRFLI